MRFSISKKPLAVQSTAVTSSAGVLHRWCVIVDVSTAIVVHHKRRFRLQAASLAAEPTVASPSYYPVYLLLDSETVPDADRIFAQLQATALSGYDTPEANDLLVVDRDTIDSGPARPGDKKKRAPSKVWLVWCNFCVGFHPARSCRKRALLTRRMILRSRLALTLWMR